MSIAFLAYFCHMSMWLFSGILSRHIRVEIALDPWQSFQVQIQTHSDSNCETLKKTYEFSGPWVPTSVNRITGPSRKHFLNHSPREKDCYFCLCVPAQRGCAL